MFNKDIFFKKIFNETQQLMRDLEKIIKMKNIYKNNG